MNGPIDMGPEPPPMGDEHLGGRVIPIRREWGPKPAPHANGSGNGADGAVSGPPPPDDDGPPAPLRSGSYASAVRVVEDNMRDVLEGRALEYNEMAGVATLARQPLTEVDLARIRFLSERRLPGGVDRKGNQKPLALHRNDILDAVRQVADTRRFHPIRAYLSGLKWDGVQRIRQLPDLMTVEDTPLAQALLRSWLISAVARVCSPGCQVDTVLVLVGPQGARKSSFLRVLAGADYFVDTPIDIGNKDAYIVIRRAWLVEWPELESLNRARDAEQVKAFITSPTDTYRPPFDRMDVKSPRSCVICGTTNRKQFLVDETGGRRFWPLWVRFAIDLDRISAMRDQIWAEALEAYTAGERWYLSPDMEALLREHQADFTVSDAWEGLILAWTTPRAVEFSIADVLQEALKKPAGQWTRGDEMRVSRVLTQNGYESRKLHRGGRTWTRSSSQREPGSDDV